MSFWSVYQTDAQLIGGEQQESTALAAVDVQPRFSLLFFALTLLGLGLVATRGLRQIQPWRTTQIRRWPRCWR